MIKPNLAEWFRNPPSSIPEKLSALVDCKNAFKISVVSDDFVFIYDKNLTDVHVIFNAEGETILAMSGRMNEKNYTFSNDGDNTHVLFSWGEPE